MSHMGDRGFLDRTIEPPIECVCGGKICEYSIGYGRTPYGIFCHWCKLSLHDIMPSGVGWHLSHEHAIEAFRDYCMVVRLYRDKHHTKPSDAWLREYYYRQYKGWGHNPQ